MKTSKEDYLRPATTPEFDITFHVRWAVVLVTISLACMFVICTQFSDGVQGDTGMFLVAALLVFVFSLIHAIQDYRRSHKAADLIILCGNRDKTPHWIARNCIVVYQNDPFQPLLWQPISRKKRLRSNYCLDVMTTNSNSSCRCSSEDCNPRCWLPVSERIAPRVIRSPSLSCGIYRMDCFLDSLGSLFSNKRWVMVQKMLKVNYFGHQMTMSLAKNASFKKSQEKLNKKMSITSVGFR